MTYLYKGNKLNKPANITKEKEIVETLMPYTPSPELVRAVNHAIILKRALLLKGEPGCGKTLLAKAVAHEFGAYPDRYFEWRVKSTAKAQDGLYTFDYLKRLHDVQAHSKQEVSKPEPPLTQYITYGAMGNAFRAAKKNPAKPVILLIDEIDKADIDFPNDLLHELEQKNFTIPELDKNKYPHEHEVKVPKDNNLIIFITSNNEKELPDAFLRRCLFHYIEFPKPDQMKTIVARRCPNLETNITEELIETFYKVREQYKTQIPNDKPPSTSELLDWFELLSRFVNNGNKVEKERLMKDISILLKSENAVKTIKL